MECAKIEYSEKFMGLCICLLGLYLTIPAVLLSMTVFVVQLRHRSGNGSVIFEDVYHIGCKVNNLQHDLLSLWRMCSFDVWQFV